MHTQFKWVAMVKYQMVEPGGISSSVYFSSSYCRSHAFFITIIIRVHVCITKSCRQMESPWLLLVVMWFIHYLKYSFHLQKRLCSDLKGYYLKHLPREVVLKSSRAWCLKSYVIHNVQKGSREASLQFVYISMVKCVDFQVRI